MEFARARDCPPVDVVIDICKGPTKTRLAGTVIRNEHLRF